MYKMALFIIALMGVYPAVVRAMEIVRIPTFTVQDPIIEYLNNQLELALAITEEDFGQVRLVHLKIPMEEERQLRNLNQNITDIAWATCSLARNENYQPVLIPQIAGLFGIRVSVIREGDQRLLEINDIDTLKELIVVQSPKWQDYDILVNNGFTVLPSDRFSAYRAIQEGLADFYPRGIAEVTGEMQATNTEGLAIAPQHVLRYPLLYLVYVKKSNMALAERLTQGFQHNLESGVFQTLMQSQPWFKRAKTMLLGRTVIDLENEDSLGECLQVQDQHKSLLQAPYTTND
tara:strand:- start:795 stop:1664 length:870 start_codon:yes stop_codon:yes gene_type:complete